MKIFIPTLGRPNDQHAYAQLDAAGLAPTLVTDTHDPADYSAFRHVSLSLPPGIAAKRQAILDMAGGEKFAMVDDEVITEAVFEENGKCVITVPTKKDLKNFFKYVDKMLDKYAHGGVHTHHFVNYAPKPFMLNRSYVRGGYSFFNPALMPTVPRFSGKTAEDVRFMIDLLQQGLDYFIMTSCCMKEQKSKSLPSHFTQTQKNIDMLVLGAFHPQHVRHTKDGRITLTYAGILKHAKRRIHNATT